MTQPVYPRRKGSAGKFFAGFFIGIMLCVILAAAGGLYLYKNPQKVARVAVREANNVVRRTMDSMPKNYLAQREVEISQLFSRFVSAYSQGRLSADAMDQLMQAGFGIAADQQVTPQEIDAMMIKMRQILKTAK
ncbi:hypothetical protein KAR48_16660 [bacterium]|nr:hypothetical protein [bacterium]